MNLNSLWKPNCRRQSHNRSCNSRNKCQEADCFRVQRRMDQFDQMLKAEHARIQDHFDALSDLKLELKSDCKCRNRVNRQLSKLEKRVMKLRAELQSVRKCLLDSDSYLHQNEQRQQEMQHRLQELWNLITDCFEFRDVDLQDGGVIVPTYATTTLISVPTMEAPTTTTPPKK